MAFELKNGRTRLLKVVRSKLTTHPVAQRKIRPGKLEELVQKFDLDLIGTLIVVQQKDRADEGFLVVNGQHRINAFDRLCPDAGDWEFNCEVHRVKNDAEASLLTLGANDSTPLRALDEFILRVRGGEASAVGIHRALKGREFKVRDQRADGNVSCVSTLEKLFSWDVLESTFDLNIEAWGRRYAAYEGRILRGVGRLLHGTDGTLDRARLRNAMQKYPGGPGALAGDAKGRLRFNPGKSLDWCVAAILVDCYNKGSRSSRLEWK